MGVDGLVGGGWWGEGGGGVVGDPCCQQADRCMGRACCLALSVGCSGQSEDDLRPPECVCVPGGG